jgi:hypothetical protein
MSAAWSYRHRPAIGVNLRLRSEGQPPEVLAYCWVAQCRLHARFHKIASTKNRNVAVVAVARELSGVLSLYKQCISPEVTEGDLFPGGVYNPRKPLERNYEQWCHAPDSVREHPERRD